MTAQLYQIVIIFIAHLLEICDAGFINIADHFAILIGLVGVVIIVVITIVDDDAVLLALLIIKSTNKKVLGKTKRGQHRKYVEKQSKQSHRRE